MRSLLNAAFWAAFFVAPALANGVPEGFDVYVLGESHDNRAHQARQAAILETLAPKAVVFEMLTPDEARSLAGVERRPDAMMAAVTGFHWFNIEDYAGVLAASAVIIGAALPRAQLRAAFSEGAAAVFHGDAEGFGLLDRLPPEQQSAREALQFDAHCEAMPMEMMVGMVEAQRLRDAAFAQALITAAHTHGTPVVLITGNGHARVDWGVPAFLARAAPELRVYALGQGEGGTGPLGAFSDVETTANTVDRSDPCLAFQ